MTTLSPPRPTPTTRPDPGDGGTPPRPLAGFGALLRFTARRDRVRVPVWIASVVGVVTASAASVVGLYSTPADLQGYAEVAQADAAVKAITGPGYGLGAPTQGAVVMNELEIFAFIGVALMSTFMVTRHTRAEEDTDRAELVRAAPVGRHAALAATCTWVAGLVLVVGAGSVLGLLAVGLPATGSAAFGAATAGIGLLFVGVAAVAAQVASTARACRAIAGAALGASFVVRAAGDVGSGRLSWLSPLGWAQSIRAYADERWWVLALLGGGTAVLLAAAVALAGRRDLGAGLLPQRPGRERAGPLLASPLGLAVRLQRTSLIAWSVGIGLTGFFYGIVADQADQLADNQAVADILAQAGQGTITESFLATSTLMLALIASGFAVAAVLRLRSEELEGRAEAVLATPVSRARWLDSHLLVATVGSVAVMAVTGVLTGVGYALQTGDAGEVLPLVGASLATVPALLVLSGLTVTLVGLRPGWAPAAWAGVALAAVVGLLAESLGLPQWVQDLSPFEHVPALPAAPFELLPVAVLTVVALVLVAFGRIAIDHRDVG